FTSALTLSLTTKTALSGRRLAAQTLDSILNLFERCLDNRFQRLFLVRCKCHVGLCEEFLHSVHRVILRTARRTKTVSEERRRQSATASLLLRKHGNRDEQCDKQPENLLHTTAPRN